MARAHDLDLFLCNLPPAALWAPMLGPALIMSWVREAGYQAKYRDFNADLFHATKDDPDLVEWYVNDCVFQDEAIFDAFFQKYLAEKMESWIDEIEERNPRWVGISLLSYRCKPVFERFANRLRQRLPQVKIVIGGGFVDERKNFRESTLSAGLVDAFVTGEGEQTILDILSDNLEANGINGKPQATPLDQTKQLRPDYTDINIDDYGYRYLDASRGEISFYVESSRGCIRKCRFCNVPQTEFSYRFRPPEDVLEEIKYLRAKYGISFFRFADSLVNGSMKYFLQFCEMTAEYNKSIGNQLKLHGYFVIRPEKHFSPKHFKVVAAAGFKSLALGVESGSETVRKHMLKKYHNEDFYYTLAQCKKHRIHANLLFMVGYPTETEQDFQETLDMLDRMQEYRDILKVKCSWRVTINDQNSQLFNEIDELGIKMEASGEWGNEHVNTRISLDRYRRFVARIKKNQINFVTKVNDDTMEVILRDSVYRPEAGNLITHI